MDEYSKRVQAFIYCLLAFVLTILILFPNNSASYTGKDIEAPQESDFYFKQVTVIPKPKPPLESNTEPIRAYPVQNEIHQYARDRVDANQWDCLYVLWTKESNWKPYAQNTTSTAYGIAQFLNSTWAGTGYSKSPDYRIQIEAGLVYIQQRYGTPCNALHFHNINNWY